VITLERNVRTKLNHLTKEVPFLTC